MTAPATFDTIVAPATPLGRSALAIVRIDGPGSHEILRLLTHAELAPVRMASHVVIHGIDAAIDDCVAVRYEGPRSFTGNDLVEITLHGNPLLVQRTVAAAVSHGARHAEPGEFTERAVLNGKIDLTQAESIADLIDARTDLQARLSLRNLEGALGRAAGAVRETLLTVVSRLEAALDFSEEGYEFISPLETLASIDQALAICRELGATYARGSATRRGINAVILGAPNAGKSTLLNRLIGHDRAIVTDVPGTTRDILRETLEIGGLPVTLADTAGLRETADPVESIGIDRARSAAAAAEIAIYLIDSKNGVTGDDRSELERLSGPIVRVFTKTDLSPAPEGELGVSAVTGAGIEELVRRLDELVRELFSPPELSPVIVNERQQRAVAEATEALELARASIGSASEEIVLVDLYRATAALGALIGAIRAEDIYTEIFAKFCIGK